MRTREAVPEDKAFLVATAEQLAAFGPPPWRPGREIVEGEVRTIEAFFDFPPESTTVLVAESTEGDRLGFVYLERALDYFTWAEHGHVGIIAVAPHAEGRGVGGLLMRAGEEWARQRGYRKLTLNVFEGNRHAREVYEHLGYAAETLRYVKFL
jgi:GNAT superfamily N-acetyltransferase